MLLPSKDRRGLLEQVRRNDGASFGGFLGTRWSRFSRIGIAHRFREVCRVVTCNFVVNHFHFSCYFAELAKAEEVVRDETRSG